MADKRAKPSEAPLPTLEQALGHGFGDPALLEQALTHGSLRHELLVAGQQPAAAEITDNERLEFLGDAVVGLLVAESLFRRFPASSEGELTRLRAALVSREHLGHVGEQLQLGRWLRMGRGEARSGGRTKAVLLANCVEALVAALYLDSGGLAAPAAFVERAIVEPELKQLYADLKSHGAVGDYKSALQEFLQARGGAQPEYVLTGESGPDHRKRFAVEVCTAATELDGRRALARGAGSTKKKAEQGAAKRALERLQNGLARAEQAQMARETSQ